MNQQTSQRVLDYFKEISKIPRCTGNEKAISDYLVEFAKSKDLEYSQDDLNNIVIRKSATKGYEEAEKIILQGHMDMVCEKGTSSTHDFTKDPIRLIEEDGFLRADDTTLGADDGIAIAMGLAILESDQLEHPALELLVTVSEETDMSGALGLSKDLLEGNYLINIDSEEEGILTVGSAGGVTIFATHLIRTEPPIDPFYEITFNGLEGGHSGMEIDKSRGNMLKVMAFFMHQLDSAFDNAIASFVSGTLDNAIPRSGKLVVTIADYEDDAFHHAIEKTKEAFQEIDGELSILVKPVDPMTDVWKKEVKNDVLSMIDQMPTGVNTKVDGSELVESSNNLALIREMDGQIYLEISVRSSDIDKQKQLVERCIRVLNETNFQHRLDGAYPAWAYRPDSVLRDKAEKVYREQFNKDFETIVIHAGLECGAIASKYPEMDMISIGPNISGAHTPKEQMELASVERVFHYITNLLKELR